jgi:hypothetical protein
MRRSYTSSPPSVFTACSGTALPLRFKSIMEAARTSETSVDIQLRTRQYIPEDCELHTRRRENLKSHTAVLMNQFCVLFSLHNSCCKRGKTN